jgi:hypothetical protein
MSYDASAQTLRCPYCGSENLEKRDDVNSITASQVIRFKIDQADAQRRMRIWLGRGFWRPSDLAASSSIQKISGVYVPYWVFAADTHTYWTADTGSTPMGARSDWYPVSGENRSSYAGLLVGASSVLSPTETEAICPFDLSESVDASDTDLENAIVEQFTVPRKYARPLARQGLESSETKTCAERYLTGRHRNLKVNVRIEQLRSEPILFPVWVMAYQYRDQLYRILINGQTGEINGDAPFSKFKAFMVASLVFLLMLVIFVMILFANR